MTGVMSRPLIWNIPRGGGSPYPSDWSTGTVAVMSGWQSLRKVGNEFLIGGLVIVAASLLVIHLDQLASGGRDSVVATCVLFLWAGAIAVGLGLVLRSAGRARGRSSPSPFSRQWRPPPVVRARTRR